VTEKRMMDLEQALERLAQSRTDEAAWTALHNSLWPYVFAVAFRELKGAARAAEDVAQETFLRLVRSAPFERLEEPSDMRAYAAAVARNVARDTARREARLPMAEAVSERGADLLGPLGPQLPEGTLERARTLLEPQDVALLDLLIRGDDIRSVAATLGIRYGTAAVRIHRLRKRLRKLLMG
jgi:RNA polymerase sigma factor (sigma-70 family)